MAESTCPRCQQGISRTIPFRFTAIVWCIPTAEDPAISAMRSGRLHGGYCFGHAVATCAACAESFPQQQLCADLLSHREHLCPRCRADLTESVRGHLYGCATLPAEVGQRAREACDAARRLVKQSYQAADRASTRRTCKTHPQCNLPPGPARGRLASTPGSRLKKSPTVPLAVPSGPGTSARRRSRRVGRQGKVVAPRGVIA